MGPIRLILARNRPVLSTGACSGAHSGNCFLRACFSEMNVYESNPDGEGMNRGLRGRHRMETLPKELAEIEVVCLYKPSTMKSLKWC